MLFSVNTFRKTLSVAAIQCTTKSDFVDHMVHNTGISDVVVISSYCRVCHVTVGIEIKDTPTEQMFHQEYGDITAHTVKACELVKFTSNPPYYQEHCITHYPSNGAPATAGQTNSASISVS